MRNAATGTHHLNDTTMWRVAIVLRLVATSGLAAAAEKVFTVVSLRKAFINSRRAYNKKRKCQRVSDNFCPNSTRRLFH